MDKYDGWVIKSYCGRNPWFLLWTFAPTRKEVIELFEKQWIGELWKKYRRQGFHKLVKVKLVEVE